MATGTLDITPILSSAQSSNAAERQQAEQQLKQLQETNHAIFLYSLAIELANNGKPSDSRRLAGLILKNALDAKDEGRKAELVQQWLSMEAGVRQQIKAALLGTLGAGDLDVRHTSALVVAKVAAIEIPQESWPDLVTSLLTNMNAGAGNDGLRQATLEALGYVCEELGAMKEDYLDQKEVNSILTAVAQGMRREEANAQVRLAATTALYNALEFAHSNFDNDQERNYLMQVVCEGAVSPDASVRQASMECLVKIAANYYEKLPQYMAPIFTITAQAVKDQSENVALQAIEFWSTICEEEIDLNKDIEDGVVDSQIVHHNFIKNALPHLVPLLLEQLTKQDESEDQDEGTWNMAMAGGTCLELAAQTVGDAIVPLVMPYVQDNINKKSSNPEDWRFREAATFAFGSILEGPSPTQLAQLVHMGLSFMLTAMADPVSHVRNTTAWTIGRIFEFVHGADATVQVINETNLPQIMQVLLTSIKDEPFVAEKVCYALSQLFAGFASSATSPVSPYFQNVVQALLETAARQCEPHEADKLQQAAFVGIQEVVRSASRDMLPLVGQLIGVILGKLNETLTMLVASAEDRERQSERQGLLCGVVQVSIVRLADDEQGVATIQQVSDHVMETLLRVFNFRHATVHEEALLVVGALTNALGEGFVKYMDAFIPVLEMGLQNFQEWHTCLISVGVLGDIAGAIKGNLAPFCDRLMALLFNNLQSPEVHRSVKPPILHCFGDIAMAIEDKFGKYLVHVLAMLDSAQTLSVQQQQNTGDEDIIEYNNTLRAGIFGAYAGLLNGLSAEMCTQHMSNAVRGLLGYIEAVYSDKINVDDSVLKPALELLGDISAKMRGVGAELRQTPFVVSFVQECRTSGDPGLVESATWVASVLHKA